MTAEAADTAALDAELAERLFGMHLEESATSQHPKWTDGEDWFCTLRGCPQYLSYSTTGDGRDMVERGLLERGYTICVHIFKDVTWVDVFAAPQESGGTRIVVENVEASNTNLAVARAAAAALRAEAP